MRPADHRRFFLRVHYEPHRLQLQSRPLQRGFAFDKLAFEERNFLVANRGIDALQCAQPLAFAAQFAAQPFGGGGDDGGQLRFRDAVVVGEQLLDFAVNLLGDGLRRIARQRFAQGI
ncbi:conserved hypothetical protein [Ricinus communis]|uniref:Uncharacterized protein n=1 Tax=Ricinus communis TaxID=3988 RepID=B9TK93_RICCO|nr:conserved hypothetical protein [Ricinus communis]